MAALHVVGIDFKHRLCEHPCLPCGTDVLVSLLRGCLLRSFAHQNASGEGTCRLSVKHIFVEFLAVAVWNLMVDERVVVHHLVLVGYGAAVEHTLRALAT